MGRRPMEEWTLPFECEGQSADRIPSFSGEVSLSLLLDEAHPPTLQKVICFTQILLIQILISDFKVPSQKHLEYCSAKFLGPAA